MADELPTVKSGFATTEFWHSMAPLILGLVIVGYGVWAGDLETMWGGVTLAIGSTGAYGLSRGIVKSAASSAAATVAAASVAAESAAT